MEPRGKVERPVVGRASDPVAREVTEGRPLDAVEAVDVPAAPRGSDRLRMPGDIADDLPVRASRGRLARERAQLGHAVERIDGVDRLLAFRELLAVERDFAHGGDPPGETALAGLDLGGRRGLVRRPQCHLPAVSLVMQYRRMERSHVDILGSREQQLARLRHEERFHIVLPYARRAAPCRPLGSPCTP